MANRCGKSGNSGRVYFLGLQKSFPGFPSGTGGKNPPANAGDTRDLGLIPGLEKSPEGNGNQLQYSCLEKPMDKEPGRL